MVQKVVYSFVHVGGEISFYVSIYTVLVPEVSREYIYIATIPIVLKKTRRDVKTEVQPLN